MPTGQHAGILVRETRPAAHAYHVCFSCKQRAVCHTAADDGGRAAAAAHAALARQVKLRHACIQEAQPHLPMLSAATTPMLKDDVAWRLFAADWTRQAARTRNATAAERVS